MRPAKLRPLLIILLSAMLLSVLINAAIPVHSHSFDGATSVTYRAAAGTKQFYNRSQAPGNREYHIFGEAGRNGRHGTDGSAGRNRPTLTLQLNNDSSPRLQQYDVSGEDGSNGGSAQPGEHARNCNAPYRPEYSLKGADGGDGGNGGNGGDGGNGGNVDLFYSNIDSLRNIAINASGGRGGQPGAGATGGDGCGCVEPQWTVKYCEWEVWRRPRSVENAEWAFYSRGLSACSGVRDVDLRENTPTIANLDPQNYRYELHYQGVATTQQFFCQAGERGIADRAGRSGQNGRYGRFRLIPQPSIPQEMIRHTDTLKNLIDRQVQFVKNIWVQNQGLPSLLNAASDVPNGYTYLKSTERPQFRLDWAAEASPTSLGIDNVNITVAVREVGEQAQLTYDIPGTLDYTLNKQSGVHVITVTNGFAPSRLGLFDLVEHTRGVAESELTLTDGGSLRNLLQSTTISVSCFTKQSASGVVSNDYQLRHNIIFEISKAGPLNSRLAITGDNYTLSLGQIFSPWLRDSYDVRYVIDIQQKTNSGAVYNQTMKTEYRI